MKLDHCVYFSNKNPLKDVQRLKAEGYPAVVGGSHIQWGTQNALLYTGNAYIEYLSIEKPEIAKNSTHPLTRLLVEDLKAGEGWGTLCISVEDMLKFQKEAEDRGFSTSPIYDAQRETPEGKVLRWKMLFIDPIEKMDLPFPFFIEWEEKEEDRLQNLRDRKSLLPENERIRVESCFLACRNPVEACNAWKKLLQVQAEKETTFYLKGVAFHFIPKEKNGRSRLVNVTMG